MSSIRIGGRIGLGRTTTTALAVVAAISLSACSGASSTPSATSPAATSASTAPIESQNTEPVTLTVLIPSSGLQVGFEAVAKAFHDANPTVTIEFQAVPSGTTYGQALLTQLQAGTAPDVIYTNGGSGAPEALLPLAKAGRLADLSSSAWTSSVPAAAASLYQVDGKFYGLPLDLNPLGVVYNVDQFTALGLTPPTTFDELLALCQTIKATGKTPIAVPGQYPRLLGEMLAAKSRLLL